MTSISGSPPDGIERERISGETAAPWDRIAFQEPEDWVEKVPYDDKTVAKEGAHQTYHLWTRQTDADSGKTFHATAVRLETALAVQNQSQWSINFDPRFHHLTLHWLRIVRNSERIDQLQRSRMRLIQRETQLERFVISGGWTLLVVFDDVRPGDTIEAGYTFKTKHPICGDWSETFFAVPAQIVVGNFRLSVVFDEKLHPMTWKTSDDAPARQVSTLDDGRTRWLWEASQPVLRDNEVNIPSSHLDYIWIQVSDIPSWSALAGRVSEAWNGAGDRGELDLLGEFARPAEVNAAAVAALVRNIQDEFRYLSVDLDTGGWIPEAPGTVAKQRRGDCKDLAWLANAVLGRWGVKSRPILVGAGLCGRVVSMLPMSSLFNHAVLEVEIAGARRWFDLTLRSQGGDFHSQPVKWFEFGLPVDPGVAAPEAQPGQQANNLLAIRETIYLDTRRGEPSAVELLLRAEGPQAEYFRRARYTQGSDGFATERLKVAQRRYVKSKRLGALQVRDDRRANVFELAESFEISDVVYAGEKGERALYDVPANTVRQTFAIPDDKARRCPWAMPFPLEIRYASTVKLGNMPSGGTTRRKWSAKEFTALTEETRLSGAWTKTAWFLTVTDNIAADQLSAYRIKLVDCFRAMSWRLYMGWGNRRLEIPAQFGQLPAAELGVRPYVLPEDPGGFPEAVIGADGEPKSKIPFVGSLRRLFSRFPKRAGYMLLIWGTLLAVSALSRSCAPETNFVPAPIESRSPANYLTAPQKSTDGTLNIYGFTRPFTQSPFLPQGGPGVTSSNFAKLTPPSSSPPTRAFNQQLANLPTPTPR